MNEAEMRRAIAEYRARTLAQKELVLKDDPNMACWFDGAMTAINYCAELLEAKADA